MSFRSCLEEEAKNRNERAIGSDWPCKSVRNLKHSGIILPGVCGLIEKKEKPRPGRKWKPGCQPLPRLEDLSRTC